ncbi:cytochrome-c peroxidase [Dokdonella sp.]|uniref:cytochrome-c peroxidase n=1 Tax=Dokdonella sp. TaxID=2291710 RepID=UPI003C36E28B
MSRNSGLRARSAISRGGGLGALRAIYTGGRRIGFVALFSCALVSVAGAQILQPPQVPAGNPQTPAKVNLGKVLFWDEQLASTRSVACGTCHIPAAGGSDPRSLSPNGVHPGPDGLFGGEDDILGSPGVPLNQSDGLYDSSLSFGLGAQVTNRRPGSMVNAAYSPRLFWDGRAEGPFVDPVTLAVILPTGGALENQAIGPPLSDIEMGHIGRAWPDVVDRLAVISPLALSPAVATELLDWIAGRGYPELFEEAFGSPGVTASRLAMALASYQRTLFSNQAPLDAWIQTGNGLTPQELAGRTVFVGVAQCDNCHAGAIMSDHNFHYTGVRPKTDDPGRKEVTGNPDDEGKLRTPSVRNVALRAPYMHNGRFATLEDVVDFYDRGGDFTPNELVPLNLTPQQRADLLAFLRRPLTDLRLAESAPPFDRPRLYTESARAPQVVGSGLAGSGGLVPQMVAVEPPLIGNPSFTVAVANALGGATALLVIDASDPGLTQPVSGSIAFESIVLAGVGAGGGYGSASLAIPNDPDLDGDQWFGRWYVEDAGGGGSVAVSPLLRFHTFAGAVANEIFGDGFEAGTAAAGSATVP